MDHELDEYELALRAREGDPDALAELVERTRLRLFALAYAELRHYEDAQDPVASALLQVCLHIHELREPARVREWMQSIVRNETRRLRRRGPPPMSSLDEADGHVHEDTASLLRLDIERALRQLPGDQERVSRLYYLADLSIAEIARRTGRPAGTIKSWLHRGRQRLALEMEDYAPMKRREALKLLAAAPALATTLEESAAMATTPAPAPAHEAALIHTELDPVLIQKITEALRTGGYASRVIQPGDPSKLLDAVKGFEVLILDDWIGGRSAFEFLMYIRSRLETKYIPVGVLSSNPSEFTVSAYFIAGVNRLVNKNDPSQIAQLAEPIESPKPNLWQRFTERARRVVFYAQEDAARLGENRVGTEHLLLGLIRENDHVAAKILDRLGISLETIRRDVLQQVTRGQGNLGQDMQLTPRAKTVVDFSYEEAFSLNNNYLGTEHLLLGLIREGDGPAARVLLNLGADLERTRQVVRDMQA
jgi:RNA polymerase sigma factor (sigma-70 family)